MIKSILQKVFKFFGYEIVFNTIGYEIRRSNLKEMFAIRRSFDESLIHLKEMGFYPELIIDVGAADGTPPLQQCFPQSRFFWIEPLIEFEVALKELSKRLRGDYLIAGAGSYEGRILLNVHKGLYGSAVLKETRGEAEDAVPREIAITTLNKLGLANKWNQYNKILIKADVQGFELKVLEGAGEILPFVEVIILEVSFFRFLTDAPEFYEVIHFMKNIGYVVYDIVGGVNRPLDYALAQKDIVFVREKGFFRESHSWSR